MKNSILKELFLSLNNRDQRELKKMMDSPYFNMRGDVKRFFLYLCGIDSKKEENWNRYKLFEVVYPGEKFEMQKLRYLCSFLSEIIRKYFIFEEQSQEPIEQQMKFCIALRRRNLLGVYEKQWKKLEKLQKAAPHKNIQYHYRNFQFYFERENFNNHHRRSRKGYSFIKETSYELSAHFVAGLLRQACMVQSQQAMWKGDWELPLLTEVLEEIKEGTYETSPVVNIYYHAYFALLDLNNLSNFSTLKKLIAAHWKSFPPTEMRDVYLMAINFCIRKLNKGDREFVQEALDLYKQGLENKVLLEDGYLSAFDYTNTLRLGLALKEYDWVEQFMESYTSFLHPRERKNIYQYNLAFYYFNKPDYPKAMELLRHVEFNDVFNNLDARRMLLRMYYELEEFDALDSLLDSFKVYIHRQKNNIGYHRSNYLNLIRIVRKMLKSNLNNRQVRIALRNKVEQTDSLAEKEWLLEQLRS